MCNFLSSFLASAGPIICSYMPNGASKAITAKKMTFKISKIALTAEFILIYTFFALFIQVHIKDQIGFTVFVYQTAIFKMNVCNAQIGFAAIFGFKLIYFIFKCF